MGCGTANTASTKNVKTSDADSQSVLPVIPRWQTFELYSGGTFYGGSVSVSENGRFLGQIKIDTLNNEIYWQDSKLLFIHKHGACFNFFSRIGNQSVIFSGEVDKADMTTSVTFGDPRSKLAGFVQLGVTKRGAGGKLIEAINRLPSFENAIGLVAMNQYVDGNPVEMHPCEHVGILRSETNSCSFSGMPANVDFGQMKKGSRFLLITAGNNRLDLWPDGNWLLYTNADTSFAFGGQDAALKAIYMNLRGQAQGAVSQGAPVGSNETPSADSPRASGTGFFITEDGFLISNYHVIENATKIRVATSSDTLDVKVIQTDAANDLALLKAEGNFAALPIISSRGVKLGSSVATVGFPDPSLQGFSPKLSKGEISSLTGIADDARYFQISLPVQPGNSGGALVDARGNVVGIVAAKLSAKAALEFSGALPENVNYAVKSSFLLSFLESVPTVSAKLKEPSTEVQEFENVVSSAQNASVLVLVY